MKHGGVGPVDGDMMNVRVERKEDLHGAVSVVVTGLPEFRPAAPTVVEAPVMMMQHQPETLLNAERHQFVRDDRVAREPEVMSPADRVFAGVFEQDLAQVSSDAPLQGARRVGLLGEIAERTVDLAVQRDRAEEPSKMMPPGKIRAFASHQQHLFEAVAQLSGEVRGGQLDHPADAAGPEVAVNDDQLHVPQCSTPVGLRPIHFCEGTVFPGACA